MVRIQKVKLSEHEDTAGGRERQRWTSAGGENGVWSQNISLHRRDRGKTNE